MSANTRTESQGETIVQAGEQRSSRVESLRAVAALAVVTAHCAGLGFAFPGVGDQGYLNYVLAGTYGVFFFFALTGYLIFWPFAKRYFGGGDRIDLKRYAINRALRILPLYYVVIVTVILLQEGGGTFGQWARFLTLSENFSIYTVGTVVGPAWSLVVELHFYLLVPLLAYGLGRISRGSLGRGMAILLAVGIPALALSIAPGFTDWDPSVVWLRNLPATFAFFVPGMVLALVRIAAEEGRGVRFRAPFDSADAWLCASLVLWGIVVLANTWEGTLAVICAASFLTLGACVLPLRPGPLVKTLEWRHLATLGIASYSLYLWHDPVITLLIDALEVPTEFGLLLPIALAAMVPIALLSYRFIEAPFLRLRKQWSRAAAPKGEQPTPGPGPAATSEARP